MTHTAHPSSLTHGLADHCPDCVRVGQSIRHLAVLDDEHIASLWRRMVRVELDGDESYRSAAEAAACSLLYDVAVFCERRFGIEPRAVGFLLAASER